MTWESEDASIAKVDAKKGVVTGVSDGETRIRAMSGGKNSDWRDVTVTPAGLYTRTLHPVGNTSAKAEIDQTADTDDEGNRLDFPIEGDGPAVTALTFTLVAQYAIGDATNDVGDVAVVDVANDFTVSVESDRVLTSRSNSTIADAVGIALTGGTSGENGEVTVTVTIEGDNTASALHFGTGDSRRKYGTALISIHHSDAENPAQFTVTVAKP